MKTTAFAWHILAASLLASCGADNGGSQVDGDADACPERASFVGEPCCIDTAECSYEVINVEWFVDRKDVDRLWVTVDSLCEGCPATLDEALMDDDCQAGFSGCGLVRVDISKQGSIFVSPTYDSASGELVGAQGQTNEGLTQVVDGCCGKYFAAGRVQDPSCTAVENVQCVTSSDDFDGGT